VGPGPAGRYELSSMNDKTLAYIIQSPKGFWVVSYTAPRAKYEREVNHVEQSFGTLRER
jgi:hypothetical protein